jgi:hypothetical protein
MTLRGTIADEIRSQCVAWEKRLRTLPEELISGPRNAQGRSIRQIVGHMADSASNNTHRVIHLQYQQSPVAFPDYANLGNNERWIAIQNYQEEEWEQLIDLWVILHLHLAHVILQVKEEKLDQVWTSALGEAISLEAMIRDFPRHMHLHLDEIAALL